MILRGMGASRGVFEGRARVLRGHSQLAELRPGEVLVVSMTDPDWAEAFEIASAVVTEIGSKLCHAAIVAREYKLPCVVNVDGALSIIRSGMRLRVDGAQGTVEILE